jgi:hypothetical protein
MSEAIRELVNALKGSSSVGAVIEEIVKAINDKPTH